MAFKDLLESLQQSAAQTQRRRMLGEEVLTNSLTPLPADPSGGGQGRRQGKGKASPNKPTGGRKLDAFLKAISTQESGGNYGAVGIPTKYGTAYGKYQILDSNIKGSGGWDQEILGRNISVNKFLNTPRLQERIAQGKLSNYFQEYGPGGAAKAWYAGPGNAHTNSNASQYGGPSINSYAASVLKHMRGYL